MSRHRASFSLLVLLVAGACTDSTSPSPGAIQVVVATIGVDRDQDGYQLILNQRPPLAVALNDTLVMEVKDGAHTVVLGGLAANCVLQGPEQQQVLVVQGRSETARFTVSCGGLTGVVRVEAVTTGDAVDADGYQVTLSSPAPGNVMSLGVNGHLDVPGLIGGNYVVNLTGLSSSCVVGGGGSRQVTVRTGLITRDTVYATFQIACLGGVVDIRAPTTGPDADSAYTVSVDGGVAGVLRSTDSLSISLEVGDHTFFLSDLASNCSVQGPNPVTVTIGHGARTSLSFPVVCLRNMATARISVAMTGGTIDPSLRIGVDLVCDYWSYYCSFSYEGPLPQNGSVLVDLAAGFHNFLLLDLSDNCVASGGTSQSIDLPATDTVDVVFNVTCSPAGTVRVTAPTTGALPDDGYVLFLDNQGGVGLAANQDHVFELLVAGQHILALGDVSPACRVSGQNPRAITVLADATTDIVFQVSCDPDATLVIAAPTTGGDQDDGYLAIVDNSPALPVAANDSISVRVYGGSHTVNLVGLNFNCSYAVSTPVSIFVPPGGTATATIPVNCVPYTGAARFTVTATGPNQPSSLVLNFNCYWGSNYCEQLAIPMNGAGSVNLNPGSYVFTVNPVPANCSVSPGTSVQVNVALGVTTETAFTLVCQ